jgi:hypothetical protein
MQHRTIQQGELMNKSYLAAVLILTSLLGVGISAHAQDDIDKIAANVPFDFVAGGKTLPAGTYTVSRVSPEASPTLVIRSSNDDSVFVIPMFVDRDAAQVNGGSAVQAGLSFEHVGDKYFLSQVETLGGVYALRTPRPMTQVAQMKDHGNGSPSGSN